MIIWDADLPREGTARNFPSGRLGSRILPSASNFFSNSLNVSSLSPFWPGGLTLATGFPRSVISRVWPLRTARRYRPRRVLNSPAPTPCMDAPHEPLSPPRRGGDMQKLALGLGGRG